MNNSLLTRSYHRFFKYGNTAMRYISINVVLFLLFAIIGLLFSLSASFNLYSDIVAPFLALPSSWSELPYRIYTFISYPFLHRDIFHLLFNMLWLHWMGNLFLDFFKPKQFHVVYWGGAIMGGFAFIALGNLNENWANSTLIGASAAVMAIFTAITLRIPNYAIRLLFFGDVKLKYLLLIYLVLDLITSTSGSSNAGGNISHLGGALFGFIYVVLLQRSIDIASLFKRKSKLKVTINKQPSARTKSASNNQAEIDRILDQISKSGYEGLSADDKRKLFEARKNS